MSLSQKVVPVEISKENVQAVLEDSYGFIWYGGSGLYRYEGYKSKAYHKGVNDTLQFELGHVYALFEDDRGKIWIGTTNGLFRYNREVDKIVPYFSETIKDKYGDASSVLSIYQDRTSRLWVGGKDKLFLIPDPDGTDIQAIGINTGSSYQLRLGAGNQLGFMVI